MLRQNLRKHMEDFTISDRLFELSKYCQVYKRSDKARVFHTRLGSLFECGLELVDCLEKLTEPKTIEQIKEIFIEKSNSDTECKNIVSQLIEMELIVGEQKLSPNIPNAPEHMLRLFITDK